MSFAALTTAIAVAAAPAPSGGAPASVVALGFESVAVDQDPPIAGPGAGSVVSPPALPAQSTKPPQPTEPAQSMDPAQSTDPAQTTDPAQSTDPASSAQPGSLVQVPAGLGEIVVTGRRPSPEDPLEELNTQSYEVIQSIDKAIIGPVAFAYKDVMPRPIRSGLRNFLHNLSEPIVFLNYMLQLKPGKAAETLGRFAINTTLGAAGLVDVAKREPFNLPYRYNGFANTMGYYGVKPGPYFYLPLIGSTTLRDFIGNRLDQLILPVVLGRRFLRPQYVLPVVVLNELNSRIEFDDELRAIRATQDPYVAARTYYLQKRQAEIDALRGRGDSTSRVTVPAPTSSDLTPEPTSPDPAQDRPPRPSFSRQ